MSLSKMMFVAALALQKIAQENNLNLNLGCDHWGTLRLGQGVTWGIGVHGDEVVVGIDGKIIGIKKRNKDGDKTIFGKDGKPVNNDKAKSAVGLKSFITKDYYTEIHCQLCDGKMNIRDGGKWDFLVCENFPICKYTQDFRKDDEGNIVPLAMDKPSGEQCEKCGLPMLFKDTLQGKLLACSDYLECKHINSQSTGVYCPEENCGGAIVQKISKRGTVFYSCDRHPKCTFATWNKPVKQQCPDCGLEFMVEKHNKKTGLLLVCINKLCKSRNPIDSLDD